MSAMGGDVGFSHPHMNGGPRKYQCKMCPQVREAFILKAWAWACNISSNEELLLEILKIYAGYLNLHLIKLCTKNLTHHP